MIAMIDACLCKISSLAPWKQSAQRDGEISYDTSRKKYLMLVEHTCPTQVGGMHA